MQDLITFIKNCLATPTHRQQKFSLGKLSAEEVVQLQNETGFDLTDFERIIDNYAIQHVFEKHGNPKKEELRGQIAIETEDFEKITAIVTQLEKTEMGEKSRTGRDLIKFFKTEICRYVYVEEIRNGKKQLALQAFYKQKATKK
jgi:hypothetical protein